MCGNGKASSEKDRAGLSRYSRVQLDVDGSMSRVDLEAGKGAGFNPDYEAFDQTRGKGSGKKNIRVSKRHRRVVKGLKGGRTSLLREVIQ